MNDTTGRVFKVDARVLLSLGRESIKDQTTALVELIKNSYDADAGNVEVEVLYQGSTGDYIRVADDGDGMDSSDIDNKWLRIGFSEKRKKKISAKGRRETGEKGVGRLSADRLGAMLELRSVKKAAEPVGIGVNWDEFDTDGAELQAVPVVSLESNSPGLPEVEEKTGTGTEIVIRSLRQEWSDADLEELETELSTLLPPSASKEEFKIWLKTSRDEDFRLLESAFGASAELEFNGAFDPQGHLRYDVTERPIGTSKKRHQIKSGKLPWAHLVQSKLPIPYDVGRFSVSLSFYLRSKANLSPGLTLNQLREYLDSQGGVRIYRDGIRVKPYGDPNHPEGDWLGLSERKIRNPAGAGRDDFRISTNQLVGSVLIGRDTNPLLTDSAAREGLIHGDSYTTLKAAVFGCIGILETIYHERFVARKDERRDHISGSLPVVVDEIKSDLDDLSKELVSATASRENKGSEEVLRESLVRLRRVSEKFAIAGREIEELASQTTVYRGLATVGISAAVFGHETESALAQAKLSTTVAIKAISKAAPDVPLSKTELLKAAEAINRVQVWGQFALSRVKKDKRRRTKFDASKVVAALADEMAPLFSAASITFDRNIQLGVEIRAFAMDLEALVLNLLTNAYHAAASIKKNRRVEITLAQVSDPRRVRIAVSDSGAGITKEHLGQIWQPLFSTRVDQKGKPTGTGLGLTIVKSIATELSATTLVKPKGALGGATFEVDIPN